MPLKDVRSVHLPYVIKKLEGGRYVILNREYKPLGFKTYDHVDYEAYPIALKLKGLTKAVAAKLSDDGSDNLDVIALYNDGSLPDKSAKNMEAYLKKLSILAKLKVDD